MKTSLKLITGLLISLITLMPMAHANILLFTNEALINDGETFRIGGDDDASNTVIQLEFGSTNTESLTWNLTQFELSEDLAIQGGLSATDDIDFSVANALRIREVNDPNTNAACTTIHEISMNTANGQLMRCTSTGAAGVATWTNIDTTGGSADFEGVYGNDVDNTLTTSNGDFTVNTGTGDFIVTSNDWSVDATGNTTTEGLDANGVTTIGDGGDTVTIDSSSWDITAAGAASGFTGFTSSGVIDFSGASRLALHSGAANPGTCTEGDIFYNTTDDTTYICTAADTFTALSSGSNPDFEAIYATDTGNDLLVDDNSATAFTIGEGANDYIVINTTDGLEAVEIAQTLTANGAFDANGVVTIGDNGDTVTIDSSSWDITGAGVGSGFTGFTSTGTVNFSGAGAFRIRENADPATNAACATLGELILDTTDNEIQVCTSTGAAGFAAWVTPTASNANTVDGLDSAQLLRSDTSDNYTSGTLTFDAGTTLLTNGTLNANGIIALGDNGDAISINSSSWDITNGGIASGFTGFTSTGIINFAGASRLALHSGTINPLICTEGDIFYNTTLNTTYVCTATNIFTALSSGNPDFETVYGADAGNDLLVDDNSATAFTIGEGANDYIVINTTDGLEAVEIAQTLTANGAFDANGIVTIGDNEDTVTIDSSSWNITGAGAASGFTSLTVSGTIQGGSITDGNATLTGGAINGMTGGDATTENTIESFIFDTDAENITGVWEVQDNVAFNFGTDADVSIVYDATTDNRLEITGPNANVFIEDNLNVGGLLGAGLTNCTAADETLKWNSATNQFSCSTIGSDSATFIDTTAPAMADDDITELFDNVTRPNITTDSATSRVLISLVVTGVAAAADGEYDSVRIVRETDGTNPSCAADPQVGQPVSGFTTDGGAPWSASGTFIDFPGVAGEVRYTVCTSALSQAGGTVNNTVTSVTVGLLEVGE